MNKSVLTLKGITKEYKGIPVLRNVDLELQRGTIYALLGSNGVGKTTLAHIIIGIEKPTSGEIQLNGKKCVFRAPYDSRAAGIEMCGRENNIFPSLTVAENMEIMCSQENTPNLYSKKESLKRAKARLEKYQIDIEPTRLMRTLSLAELYLIQFISCINENTQLIIMDEIVDSLTIKEMKTIFSIVEELKQKGITIIYITHKIGDALQIADEILIMRDGCVVEQQEKYKAEFHAVRHAMVGNEERSYLPKINVRKRKLLMRVEDLSGERIKNVSFELSGGEIVGIAGAVGSGRTSLLRTLLGVEERLGGKILVKDKPVTAKYIRKKVGYLPERREQEAIFSDLSVIRNLSAGCIERISSWGIVSEEQESYKCQEMMEKLSIKCSSPKTKAMYLSSGNKQKMLVARSMLGRADIYIFDEPTKGIDSAGKIEIYNIFNNLTKNGAGILLVSSDYHELVGMCDRVIVVRKGEMLTTLTGKDINLENLSALCME